MTNIRKQLDETLANMLINLRTSYDITQNALANELKLTQPVITFYEKGTRLPSIDVLERYSEYFQYGIVKLYEDRITTIKNTVKMLGDEAPPHIKDEYKMILYLEGKFSKECGTMGKKFEYGRLGELEMDGSVVYAFKVNNVTDVLNKSVALGFEQLDLMDALSLLGKQGWELTVKEDNAYIFKREVLQ